MLALVFVLTWPASPVHATSRGTCAGVLAECPMAPILAPPSAYVPLSVDDLLAPRHTRERAPRNVLEALQRT